MKHQPAALLHWGRYEIYFDIAEVLAYSRELERLDTHIYDGAHLLLETHSAECAALMREFIVNIGDGGVRPNAAERRCLILHILPRGAGTNPCVHG